LKQPFKDLKPSSILGMATFFDKFLFMVLTIFALTVFLFARELFPSGTNVEISVDNKPMYTLLLRDNRTVTVKGPLGESVIEINKGKVRMKSSPCPDQICVFQGWIDRGAIICLPNKVIVSVTGHEQQSTDSDLDAVTR
jgi:hypothetical protein